MKIDFIEYFYFFLNKLVSGFSLIFHSVDGVDSYKSEHERFAKDSKLIYGSVRKRRNIIK